MKNLLFFTSLLLAFASLPANAQPWTKIYGNSPGFISKLPNGQFMSAAVHTWDPFRGGLIGYYIDDNRRSTEYLVGLRANGDTAWTAADIFNGGGYLYRQMRDACRLTNGDYIVTAYGQTYSNSFDCIVNRLDSNGKVLLTKILRKTGQQEANVLVAAAQSGEYFVVGAVIRDSFYTSGTANITYTRSHLVAEKFNSSNVRISADSIWGGGLKAYNDLGSFSCIYNSSMWGTPGYMYTLNDIQAASDGGLFVLGMIDTSKAFSIAACKEIRKPGQRPGGGFVLKWSKTLNKLWSVDIQTALNLPIGIVSYPQFSIATSDSGVVVAGYLTDTNRIANNGSFLLKLDKNGLCTDTLLFRPEQSYTGFYAGIETSNKQLLFRMVIQDLATRKSYTGLGFLDSHLKSNSFTPWPFADDKNNQGQMSPNQCGGAFLAYISDTNAAFYYNPALQHAASRNIDSLFNAFPSSVSGQLAIDNNANCAFDAGIDRSLGLRTIMFTNTATSKRYQTITGSKGDYISNVPAGIYQMSHVPDLNKSLECPGGPLAVNLSTPGYITGKNLFDTLIPSRRDMKVMVPFSCMVPGFTKPLRIYVANNGSVVTSDTLQLIKPALLNYVSAVPSPVSVLGDTITWVLNNVVPDSLVSVVVQLSTPPTTTIGTPINFSAEIRDSFDAMVADNVDTLVAHVVGPYDPNAKYVNRPIYTSARKEWVYTVTFQNTGNYSAQNVVISDNFHKLLDPLTVRLLETSHGSPKMVWQENGTLLFRFDNINLVDSMHNEPASHGYLTFMVQPRGAAKPGDTITNTAAIFFDFNTAAHTDTTRNIITESRLLVTTRHAENHFSAYPNPTAGNLIVESDCQGYCFLSDIQGRRLLTFTLTTKGRTAISLPQGLAPGIYVLYGRSTDGASMGFIRLWLDK